MLSDKKRRMNLHVLVIYNDLADGVFIERVLVEERKDEVFATSYDRQTLNEADQNPPDIIMLSATLSEPDAFQVYQQLRARASLQNIPVLFWRVPNPRYTCPRAQAAGVAGCLEFMSSHNKDNLLKARDVVAEGGSYYPSLGISADEHALEVLAIPSKKPKNVSDRRMPAKAQRLMEKYGQPSPLIVGEYVSSQADRAALADVWKWATSVGRTDIMSMLARVTRTCLDSEEQRIMCVGLREYAEQAKEQEKWDEYAGFLIALAEFEESYSLDRLALYKEALDIYARLDDWAGEAICTYEEVGIYRTLRQFDEVRRLSLRSYVLWARAGHRRGIAASLSRLADLLEIEGKYIEACRLLFCEKKLMSRHVMWKISARDCLKRLSHEHGISPDQYESKKPAEKLAQELVSEIFDTTI